MLLAVDESGPLVSDKTAQRVGRSGDWLKAMDSMLKSSRNDVDRPG